MSKPSKASAQRYLDIAEIRDDIVILKDGTLRAVLAVSSINFSLKSDEEQEGIVQAYVAFLNALDYPIQVVIQSRQLNIDAYLENLQKMEQEQVNDLLRLQIADYRSFVKELITIGQIMSKKFFVVVPYSSVADAKRGFISRLRDALTPAHIIRVKEEKFFEHRKELENRVEQVMGGLTSMGLKADHLNTQKLIELYYSTYNPDVSEPEPLSKIEQMSVETN